MTASTRAHVTSRALAMLVAFSFVAAAHAADPEAPSNGAPERSARLFIEAGPSFDNTTSITGPRTGYAIAGGLEAGRTFGLILSAGFEHYPGENEPFLIDNFGGQPPTLRVEGGGNKTVLTGTVGVRLGLPLDRVEPFGEAALGLIDYARRSPRYVHPETGAVIYPGGTSDESALLAELGLGVRTRRAPRHGWTVGVRWRNHSQLFEGQSGSSVQIRVGIVTP